MAGKMEWIQDKKIKELRKVENMMELSGKNARSKKVLINGLMV